MPSGKRSIVSDSARSLRTTSTKARTAGESSTSGQVAMIEPKARIADWRGVSGSAHATTITAVANSAGAANSDDSKSEDCDSHHTALNAITPPAKTRPRCAAMQPAPQPRPASRTISRCRCGSHPHIATLASVSVRYATVPIAAPIMTQRRVSVYAKRSGRTSGDDIGTRHAPAVSGLPPRRALPSIATRRPSAIRFAGDPWRDAHARSRHVRRCTPHPPPQPA